MFDVRQRGVRAGSEVGGVDATDNSRVEGCLVASRQPALGEEGGEAVGPPLVAFGLGDGRGVEKGLCGVEKGWGKGVKE